MQIMEKWWQVSVFSNGNQCSPGACPGGSVRAEFTHQAAIIHCSTHMPPAVITPLTCHQQAVLEEEVGPDDKGRGGAPQHLQGHAGEADGGGGGRAGGPRALLLRYIINGHLREWGGEVGGKECGMKTQARRTKPLWRRTRSRPAKNRNSKTRAWKRADKMTFAKLLDAIIKGRWLPLLPGALLLSHNCD